MNRTLHWYDYITFESYYQASNNFLKGVYPVSEKRYTPGKSTYYKELCSISSLQDSLD